MRRLRFFILISHGFKYAGMTKNIVFRLRREHATLFYSDHLHALESVRDVFRPDMVLGITYDLEDLQAVIDTFTSSAIPALIVPLRARVLVEAQAMRRKKSALLHVTDTQFSTGRIVDEAFSLLDDLRQDLAWLAKPPID